MATAGFSAGTFFRLGKLETMVLMHDTDIRFLKGE